MAKKTKVLVLNISAGCSPAVKIVFDSQYANNLVSPKLAKGLAKIIERRMKEAVASLGGKVEYSLSKKIKVDVHPQTDLVARTEKERREMRAKKFDTVMKKFDKMNLDIPSFADKAKENPDNGKEGWWGVYGMRHGYAVRATSAPEAIEKTKDKIDETMLCTVRFIGESPDFIELF
jgi:hypothetical protein